MRELLFSEIRTELLGYGLTLSDDAARALLDAIDQTTPYLGRGGNLATAARARLRRLCGRIIIYARRARETEVSAATVAKSRRESSSWDVVSR